jgi:hypothetical protein
VTATKLQREARQTVGIYCDPLTEQELEGVAVVVEWPPYSAEELDYVTCSVRFVGEHHLVSRKVSPRELHRRGYSQKGRSLETEEAP